MDSRAAVEAAARTAYGRLVAFLAARTRDIAAAEDALAAAFVRALETWPERGVPEHPEAWLLTVARNRLNDGYRHDKVRADARPTLDLILAVTPEADRLPDDRLRLMFVCAHPAIDAAMHAPLMLQTVLGLNAERIASAFLVKPAAMGQRLSRAKAKIRDAGIGFEVPEAAEWPGRLPPLLNAVYAAFALAWRDYAGDEGGGLPAESLALGEALLALMPPTAELNGLVALMLYCEARHGARLVDGRMVPLDEQDAALWDWAMIRRANALLNAVIERREFGRFQIEAAIQSQHMARSETGVTDWGQIVSLYEGLLRMAPSLAAMTGYAVALCEAGRVVEALAALDGLDAVRVGDYQPWWAARAHVLARLEHRDEALTAYDRAMALSRHVRQRDFLRDRRDRL